MGFQQRRDDDARAIERYRYMLRTAPPEQIEQAHTDAFARLTLEQRREVLDELARHVAPGEIRGDDPAALARTATRAEMRAPGVLERAWGGPGLGGMFLSTLAGALIGSAVAQQFFADDAAAAEADAGTEGDAAAGGDNASLGPDEDGDFEDFDGEDLAGDVGGDFGDVGGF